MALCALWVSVWLPAATEATVRIKTRADGTKYVYDERPARYSGWTSSRLRPVRQGEIADLIDYYARDRGLSPRLVQAVIQVESDYDPRARSRKGAMGLMQLMPDTAKLLRVDDPYDPSQNIRGGTLYLRRQLDRFSGDLTLALAAYNAGPGAVAQYGGVPPYRETRSYVSKVLGLYRGDTPPDVAEPARGAVRQQQQPAAAKPPTEPKREGQKVYMSRGGNNRITFTTAPPRTY